MLSRGEIKTIAKTNFKANYWPCVGWLFLASLIPGSNVNSANFNFSNSFNNNSFSNLRDSLDR